MDSTQCFQRQDQSRWGHIPTSWEQPSSTFTQHGKSLFKISTLRLHQNQHGFLFKTTKIWPPLFGKEKKEVAARPAWGVKKGRESLETQLQTPEHTLSFPAITPSPRACILPSVPTPLGHQSNLLHLSQNPDFPCPKVYLLKTVAALIIPTIP